MSATVPPGAADTGDRASDFGSAEFWRKGVPSMAPESIPPESRAPIALLSAEQQARRRKLQRLVSYVVGGAVLFTGVATLAHFAFRGRDLPASPTSIPAAVHAAAPSTAAEARAPSVANEGSSAQAGARANATSSWREFVKSPSADPRALEDWSDAASTLNGNDLAEALKQLTRMTTTGRRTQREAAGLGLAILWRAQAHPAEAHKMLTRLAKHAGDRSVRDYAGKMLARG